MQRHEQKSNNKKMDLFSLGELTGSNRGTNLQQLDLAHLIDLVPRYTRSKKGIQNARAKPSQF